MNKNRKQHLYFDNCDLGEAYKDYTPLEDDANIDDIIESERIEFREEWFRYIEENEE